MFQEFAHYLDFWVKGQKNGFTGNLERIKLSDGSTLVYLYEHPLLYVDQWQGADLGGGQTLLYKVKHFDVITSPSNRVIIVGEQIARLGYSGRITGRFNKKEMQELTPVFGVVPQSEIIWTVLKSALRQANRERPLRGPEYYEYPEFPHLQYISKEFVSPVTADGQEFILFDKGIFREQTAYFEGVYDFTLIKRNLEDELPKLEPKSI